MSRVFSALANRNYRWFLSGQIVTNVGTWMQRVGQDWLVLEISHGNAVTLGITTALQFAPFLLLAPFAGVLADRISRRVLISVAGVLACGAAATLGVAVLADSATVGLVYVLAFILGVAAALDNPARQALLGQLVPREQLSNAVALNSATFNLSRMIGPATAGLTIALAGIGAVFIINAGSYLFALAAVAALRTREFHQASPRRSSGATLGGGLRYLRTEPRLVLVMAMVAVVATFACNFQITTALMANQEFHVGAAAYGVMGSVLSLGSITGSLLAARRPEVSLRFVMVAGVGVALATIAAGLMPTYSVFLVFLPVCGLLILTFTVSAQSYLQMGAADRYRGRVMGLYTLVFFGGNPLGAPLLGVVAKELGPRWGLIGGGALAALGLTVIGVGVLGLRRRRSNQPATGSRGRLDLSVAQSEKDAVRVR